MSSSWTSLSPNSIRLGSRSASHRNSHLQPSEEHTRNQPKLYSHPLRPWSPCRSDDFAVAVTLWRPICHETRLPPLTRTNLRWRIVFIHRALQAQLSCNCHAAYTPNSRSIFATSTSSDSRKGAGGTPHTEIWMGFAPYSTRIILRYVMNGLARTGSQFSAKLSAASRPADSLAETLKTRYRTVRL